MSPRQGHGHWAGPGQGLGRPAYTTSPPVYYLLASVIGEFAGAIPFALWGPARLPARMAAHFHFSRPHRATLRNKWPRCQDRDPHPTESIHSGRPRRLLSNALELAGHEVTTLPPMRDGPVQPKVPACTAPAQIHRHWLSTPPECAENSRQLHKRQHSRLSLIQW